jgi:hypothetical protein
VSPFRVELATSADDAALREILAATPMPGHIAVSFRREPSYFDAAVVEGAFRQVVVARDSQTGRIVGFGSRSIRPRYVNGQVQPIGYLSNLRLMEPYRNLGLVARGYACFRSLHADGRTPVYLTTIAEGNDRAITLLTSRRAGLPAYRFAGRYHTLSIPISRRGSHGPRLPRGLSLRPATREDRPALVDFLHTSGPRRHFFPEYVDEDLFTSSGTFRDLEPDDLLLAFHGEHLVGCIGAWDQSRFRQTVVERYSRWLYGLRPFYNLAARVRGLPELPRPHTPLHYRMAAMPLVEGDDPDVFRSLLDWLLSRLSGTVCDYLLLGLHESDPLLPIARRFARTSYVTRLYLVGWEEADAFQKLLDGRPLYLEIGSL